MNTIKRYQVYLDSRSVRALDEASDIIPMSRSLIIREMVDAGASRVGNLLAAFKPMSSDDYSWLDKMVGTLSSKGKFKTRATERVDDIYYDK